MNWPESEDYNDEPERGLVVRRQFRARPVGPGEAPAQKAATRGLLRRILDAVRDKTADDAKTIKGAGIDVLTGEARVRHSAALRNEAEAAKLFAEAESTLQDARAKQIENDRAEHGSVTPVELERAERFADASERQAAAWERLLCARSMLRMEGADAMFDVDQITAQLVQLNAPMSAGGGEPTPVVPAEEGGPNSAPRGEPEVFGDEAEDLLGPDVASVTVPDFEPAPPEAPLREPGR